MLTKDQAQEIADGLLSSVKASQNDELDARASAIPFFYKSSALSRLPQREQARMLAQARGSAFSGWQTACVMASWLCLTLLFLWLLMPGGHARAAFWLLLSASVAVGAQLRALLVRLRLQELLLASAAPPADRVI